MGNIRDSYKIGNFKSEDIKKENKKNKKNESKYDPLGYPFGAEELLLHYELREMDENKKCTENER